MRIVLICALILASIMLGCSSNETPVAHNQSLETWNMKLAWEHEFSIPTLSSPGIASNGKYVALMQSDGGKLTFLDGEGVVWEKQTPCSIALMEMNDEAIFVIGSCEGAGFYSGLNVLDFKGTVTDVKKYWYGLVADEVQKSPDGNHVCYLISGHIGCYNFKERTFWERDLRNVLYNKLSVSNDGYVVIGSDGATDKVVLLKDGKIMWTKKPSSHMAYAYGDKIVMADNGSTYILTPDGENLASMNGEIEPLLNSKYVIGYNGSVWVFDYSLEPLFSFEGFPAYLNENFLVTFSGSFQKPTLHCYNLETKKEVWNFTLPDRFRWIKMSDDAENVVIISHDGSRAWLLVKS